MNAEQDKGRLGGKTVRQNARTPKKHIEYYGGVDRPFLVAVILLLCLGTVVIFSASYPYANAKYHDSYRFVRQQAIWAALGLGVMAFTAHFKYVSYQYIKAFSKVIFAFAVVALAAVLVIGEDFNGAKRWISIGPITIQPSEIAKFAMVVFFADYADRYHDKIKQTGDISAVFTCVVPVGLLCGMGALAFFMLDETLAKVVFAGAFFIGALLWAYFSKLRERAPAFFYGILPYVAVLGAVGFLMYKEPHMSGLIIMAGITFCMMYLGGTHFGYFLAGGGIGAVGLLFLATTLSHAKGRLDVWRNPFEHLLDDGWQPAQSLYAIGSGGFWGVGFGNSRQKHLYLPEPQNDYIFSIWCEEMGFIGAMIVLAVFLFFIYRGIYIGLRAPTRFSSLLVIGIILHVGIQTVLNIAVVTNTLPSTGISLPFFSYGGTSLMILLAEMGVVLGVSKYASVEKT